MPDPVRILIGDADTVRFNSIKRNLETQFEAQVHRSKNYAALLLKAHKLKRNLRLIWVADNPPHFPGT